MIIEKNVNGSELTVSVSGRLDTATAPELEKALDFDGVEVLVFDFKELEYLSSAGLRIILTAQKTMNRQGKMSIRNVNETIMEIFDVTGFVDILTIE